MRITNSPIWFWLSLTLLFTTSFLMIKNYNASPGISMPLSHQTNIDSTYVQYYNLIEAINLKVSGKEKLATQRLIEFSKSTNLEIRNVALYELNKPKVIEKTQIVSIKTEPDVIIIDDVNVPNHNLKEIDFTPENVQKLHNNNSFLNLTSSKGNKFEYLGDIENQKANGYGIGIYESGSIYKGYWKDNQRHGKGIFTWKDGERYDGEYINDLRHGEGIYVWKNGEKYSGQWKEDRRHGEGIIFKKNGKIKNSGVWQNDKFVN